MRPVQLKVLPAVSKQEDEAAAGTPSQELDRHRLENTAVFDWKSWFVPEFGVNSVNPRGPPVTQRQRFPASRQAPNSQTAV